MVRLKQITMAQKLYTEEQVKNLLDKMDVVYSLEELIPIEVSNNDIETNKVLELYPLEFPNNEDIENAGFMISQELFTHEENFIMGAKWMREQILNQNK